MLIPAAAVVGDYVYIDGGEITQYWNGEQLWKRGMQAEIPQLLLLVLYGILVHVPEFLISSA